MRLTKYVTIPGLLLVGFLLSHTAHAGACFSDPVYERNMSGIAKIGSRVRDVACMEGSTVLTVISAGTKVHIIGETDGWYKVKLADGTIGWVGATLLTATTGQTISAEKKEVAMDQSASALGKRLAGYILLQVEKNGEAYYVNPEGSAVYMKDGSAAYEIMRSLGLGISEADFAKLMKGDRSLKERLKGRIVLQVEKKGEAHYISPRDGSITYMKNGEIAYQVMREKGLGISNKDMKEIRVKELKEIKKELTAEQKKEKSESIEKKYDVKEKPVSSSTGTISLQAKATDNGVSLFWTLTGMQSPKGFKVVWASMPQPTYPGSDYHYLTNPDTRSDTVIGLSSGKTYYFRVCEYLGGSCGVYSNEVSVTR